LDRSKGIRFLCELYNYANTSMRFNCLDMCCHDSHLPSIFEGADV